MFEGLLLRVLVDTFGAYIEGLTTENLKVAVWAGRVNLSNLRVREDALERLLQLPITVCDGFIGTFSMEVPWSKISSQPVRISIEKVYVLCNMKDLAMDATSLEENKEALRKRKEAELQAALQAALEKLKDDATESAASGQGTEQDASFRARLGSKIIDNFQITVKDVHVRFEDWTSIPRHPFALGLCLEQFSMQTTDADWNVSFIQRDKEDLMYKTLLMSAVSLYCDTQAELFTQLPSNDRVQKMKLAGPMGPTPHRQILLPCDMRLSLIVNQDRLGQKCQLSLPKYQVKADSTAVEMVILQPQYRNFVALDTTISSHRLRQSNAMFRPFHTPKDAPRAWWRYAVEATLKHTWAYSRSWSWHVIRRAITKRNRYLALCRQLRAMEVTPSSPAPGETGSASSEDPLRELQTMELDLSIMDIVLFRGLASADADDDLNNEFPAASLPTDRQPDTSPSAAASATPPAAKAKRSSIFSYFRRSSSTQGHGGNDAASPGHAATDGDANNKLNLFKLSQSQWSALYHELGLEEEAKEATEAAQQDIGLGGPQDIRSINLTLDASLKKFSVSLRSHSEDVVSTSENLCSFMMGGNLSFQSKTKSWKVGLKLHSAELKDHQTPNTVHPQLLTRITSDRGASSSLDQQLCCSVDYESWSTGPSNGFDGKLFVQIVPMQIVYNPFLYAAVASFLETPDLTSIDFHMNSATLAKLEIWRQGKELMVTEFIAQKKRISVMVDAAAPVMIIPQSCTDMSSPAIVADLGHLVVRSCCGDTQFADKSGFNDFTVELKDLNLQLCSSLKDWLEAFQVGGSKFAGSGGVGGVEDFRPIHLVEPFSVELSARLCILPAHLRDSKHTVLQIHGKLPSLCANLSTRKYEQVTSLLNALPPLFGPKKRQASPESPRGPRGPPSSPFSPSSSSSQRGGQGQGPALSDRKRNIEGAPLEVSTESFCDLKFTILKFSLRLQGLNDVGEDEDLAFVMCSGLTAQFHKTGDWKQTNLALKSLVVVDCTEVARGDERFRVLLTSEVDVDDFGVPNHQPVMPSGEELKLDGAAEDEEGTGLIRLRVTNIDRQSPRYQNVDTECHLCCNRLQLQWNADTIAALVGLFPGLAPQPLATPPPSHFDRGSEHSLPTANATPLHDDTDVTTYSMTAYMELFSVNLNKEMEGRRLIAMDFHAPFYSYREFEDTGISRTLSRTGELQVFNLVDDDTVCVYPKLFGPTIIQPAKDTPSSLPSPILPLAPQLGDYDQWCGKSSLPDRRTLLELSMDFFPPELELEFDSQVDVKIDSLEMVYVHQLALEVQDYISEAVFGTFFPLEEAFDIFAGVVVGYRHVYNVHVSSPVLLIPQHLHSTDRFEANMGDITISNGFLTERYKPGAPAVLLDRTTIFARNMTLHVILSDDSRTTGGAGECRQSMLLDKINLTAEVLRPLYLDLHESHLDRPYVRLTAQSNDTVTLRVSERAMIFFFRMLEQNMSAPPFSFLQKLKACKPPMVSRRSSVKFNYASDVPSQMFTYSCTILFRQLAFQMLWSDPECGKPLSSDGTAPVATFRIDGCDMKMQKLLIEDSLLGPFTLDVSALRLSVVDDASVDVVDACRQILSPKATHSTASNGKDFSFDYFTSLSNHSAGTSASDPDSDCVGTVWWRVFANRSRRSEGSTQMRLQYAVPERSADAPEAVTTLTVSVNSLCWLLIPTPFFNILEFILFPSPERIGSCETKSASAADEDSVAQCFKMNISISESQYMFLESAVINASKVVCAEMDRLDITFLSEQSEEQRSEKWAGNLVALSAFVAYDLDRARLKNMSLLIMEPFDMQFSHSYFFPPVRCASVHMQPIEAHITYDELQLLGVILSSWLSAHVQTSVTSDSQAQAAAASSAKQQHSLDVVETALELSLDRFNLSLIGKCKGRDLPLLELHVSSLGLNSAGTKVRQFVTVQGNISADYYNTLIVCWEPVLEPLALKCNAEQDVHSGAYDINVVAECDEDSPAVEVVLTHAFAIALLDVWETWVHAPTVDDCPGATNLNYAPCFLSNHTGLGLGFRPVAEQTISVRRVDAGAMDTPFHFRESSSTKWSRTARGREIEVTLDAPCNNAKLRIRVDRVGVTNYTLPVRIDARDPHAKEEVVYVVCHVKISAGSTYVSLESLLRVHNHGALPLQVMLIAKLRPQVDSEALLDPNVYSEGLTVGTEDEPPQVLGPIPPSQSLSVPVHWCIRLRQARSFIQVCPSEQGLQYGWSTPIRLSARNAKPVQIECREVPDSNATGALPVAPIEEDTGLFFTAVRVAGWKRELDRVAATDVRSDGAPVSTETEFSQMSIFISPSILLTNLLPVPLLYRIGTNVKSKEPGQRRISLVGTCQKGQHERLHCPPLATSVGQSKAEELYIQLRVQGYSWSAWVKVLRLLSTADQPDCASQVPLHTTARLSQQPLVLSVEAISSPSGSHDLSIFVPFWIRNLTTLPLVYGYCGTAPQLPVTPSTIAASSDSQSPSITSGMVYVGAHQLSTVVEELFQNERYALVKWSNPYLPADREAWTDEAGVTARTFTSVLLPGEDWFWETEWEVDHTGQVNTDGWEYGTSFATLCRRDFVAFDTVRRCRWIRRRTRASPEAVPDKAASLGGWTSASRSGNKTVESLQQSPANPSLCMFTPPDPTKVCLKTGDSLWSPCFPIDVAGVSGCISFAMDRRVGQSEAVPLAQLGVSIDAAPTPFQRTKVVSISSQYTIQNSWNCPLYVKQVNSSRILVLSPKEERPFHWPDAMLDLLIQVSVGMDDGEFSGPFSISQMGSFPVRLGPAVEEGEHFICRVSVQFDEFGKSSTNVTFREESLLQPMYRIRNRTPFLIWYRQTPPADSSARGKKSKTKGNGSPASRSRQGASGAPSQADGKRKWQSISTGQQSTAAIGWTHPMEMPLTLQVRVDGDKFVRHYTLDKIRRLAPFEFQSLPTQASVVVHAAVEAVGSSKCLTFSHALPDGHQVQGADRVTGRDPLAAAHSGTMHSSEVPVVGHVNGGGVIHYLLNALPSCEVHFAFPAMHVSIIDNGRCDHEPEEIAVVTATEVSCVVRKSPANATMEMSVGGLQVDNQLQGAQHPVCLVATPGSFKADWNYFGVLADVDWSSGLMTYDSVVMHLQETDVLLDDVFARRILHCLQSILQRLPASTSPDAQLAAMLSNTPLDLVRTPSTNSEALSSSEERVYIGRMDIFPMRINLTYSGVLTAVQDLPVVQNVSFLSNLYHNMARNVSLDHAPVRLNALTRTDVFDTTTDISNTVKAYYAQQAKQQLLSLLGSTDVLGNPVSLVNNLGTAFSDFFYMPAAGLVESPEEFGAGLVKGTGSLIKNSVYGVSNSAGLLSRGLGNAVSELSFDPAYTESRRQAMAEDRPMEVLQGVGYGAKALIRGTVEGLGGLVMDPLEGARRDGPRGLASGLMRGVAGSVIKPAVGATDALSKILEGVRNTTTLLDAERPSRRRPQRLLFGFDRQVRRYAARDVVISVALAKVANGAYRRDLLESHLQLSEKNTLILTDRHVLKVSHSSATDSYSLIWGHSWDQITDLQVGRGQVTIHLNPDARSNPQASDGAPLVQRVLAESNRRILVWDGRFTEAMLYEMLTHARANA